MMQGMEYALAKQLKDAGFPMRSESMLSPTLQKLIALDNRQYLSVEGEWYAVPDLSELIEACGDKFDYLQHNTQNVWTATDDQYTFGIGSIPEEAVAKLWLALHK
jgi:hypothetical protein